MSSFLTRFSLWFRERSLLWKTKFSNLCLEASPPSGSAFQGRRYVLPFPLLQVVLLVFFFLRHRLCCCRNQPPLHPFPLTAGHFRGFYGFFFRSGFTKTRYASPRQSGHLTCPATISAPPRRSLCLHQTPTPRHVACSPKPITAFNLPCCSTTRLSFSPSSHSTPCRLHLHLLQPSTHLHAHVRLPSSIATCLCRPLCLVVVGFCFVFLFYFLFSVCLSCCFLGYDPPGSCCFIL